MLPPQTSVHAIAVDGTAPDWIHLIPAGTFYARDGRGPYHLADPVAVLAATRALGMDLPIDYDHAMDFLPKGQPKPAAGWIKEFDVRDDGIYARVEWTIKGADALHAGEYRYISPVLEHTKGGEVVRIIRASLTNSPAFVVHAIANNEGHIPAAGGNGLTAHEKDVCQRCGITEEAFKKTRDAN